MPAPVGRSEETDLQDLPPLDGDTVESPESSGDDVDDDDLGSEKSPGGLDDSTGEDDAPHPDDVEVDEGEGRWLDEVADSPDLDLGADLGVDVLDAERTTATAEADEAEPPGDDGGLGEGLEGGGLDSGEEGPEQPDEELRDQDLPDLGGAEEDERDEVLLEADRISNDEPLGLKWASRPWTRVGAPVPLTSASAVACAARGALVAGRVEGRPPELLRIDLEGGCQTVVAEGLGGAEIKALAVEGALVAAVVEGGRVAVSRDGGARFDVLELRERGVVAADVVLASGVVWATTSAGGLCSWSAWSSSTGDPGLLEPRAAGAPVAALAVDSEGQCLALLVDGARRPVGLLRGGRDGVLAREALACAEPCGPGLVAARGGCVAYAARRGVVRRGPDGVWRSFGWDGSVVALAFVDGEGGLVAATYSDSDDTTGLVRLDDEGSARVMALLGPTQADIDSDGRASAIACDEPRGVVWLAGGFGVAAFATR